MEPTAKRTLVPCQAELLAARSDVLLHVSWMEKGVHATMQIFLYVLEKLHARKAYPNGLIDGRLSYLDVSYA